MSGMNSQMALGLFSNLLNAGMYNMQYNRALAAEQDRLGKGERQYGELWGTQMDAYDRSQGYLSNLLNQRSSLLPQQMTAMNQQVAGDALGRWQGLMGTEAQQRNALVQQQTALSNALMGQTQQRQAGILGNLGAQSGALLGRAAAQQGALGHLQSQYADQILGAARNRQGQIAGQYGRDTGSIMGGLQGRYLNLMDAEQARRRDVNQQYTGRTRAIMGELRGMGEQERRDINRRYDAAGNRAQQRLLASGLGNTTIGASVAQGNERERTDALGRFEERTRQQQADVRAALTGEALSARERGYGAARGLQQALTGDIASARERRAAGGTNLSQALTGDTLNTRSALAQQRLGQDERLMGRNLALQQQLAGLGLGAQERLSGQTLQTQAAANATRQALDQQLYGNRLALQQQLSGDYQNLVNAGRQNQFNLGSQLSGEDFNWQAAQAAQRQQLDLALGQQKIGFGLNVVNQYPDPAMYAQSQFGVGSMIGGLQRYDLARQQMHDANKFNWLGLGGGAAMGTGVGGGLGYALAGSGGVLPGMAFGLLGGTGMGFMNQPRY